MTFIYYYLTFAAGFVVGIVAVSLLVISKDKERRDGKKGDDCAPGDSHS